MSSAPPLGPSQFERLRPVTTNTVFKSGPLFISSKGIGWKSWKRRWFILTRTSLVFFKDNPSALPQRGGEVNITLGGIDLNNSGSVVVREDKKLLTVLFPDGRDGRAFTLKAESIEELVDWKNALELALAQAPSPALVMGHNGIFCNDTTDVFEGSAPQWRDKRPVKSMVVGRPILLALEDIDGRPSFLEKALRFLEKFGTRVEGILRQSADVEEVDRRVQEYEQGRTDFSSDEDAHVIGDCVKHVLRELPSSPVPASCCMALLEAYRIERKESRINALRSAILETFPEPNRRLLQRILKMMHTIAAHTAENRMTPSAVAACMAPLLLRPLLAGECELEADFDASCDGSAQLMAAANAANNAQAIITTLIEEYENIFDDTSLQRCSLSPDSHIDESGSDQSTDDGNLDVKGNGYHDAEDDIDPEVEDDSQRILSGKLSESSGYAGSDLYDYKAFGADDLDIGSPEDCGMLDKVQMHGSGQSSDQPIIHKTHEKIFHEKNASCSPPSDSLLSMGDILSSMEPGGLYHAAGSDFQEKAPNKINGQAIHAKRSSLWQSNNGRSNSSMELADSSGEEELAIQRLEIAKNELRNRIAKEAKGNAILQASLERRKQALHERRLALEQDVSRLQEQLQAERDLRAALEVGLSMSSGQFPSSRVMDSKTRAELEEIALAEADVARLKQKVAELHVQLNQQRLHQFGSLSETYDHFQHVQSYPAQQKVFSKGFGTTAAFCNHEKKPSSEESPGSEWSGKQLQLPQSSKQVVRKHSNESTTTSDLKSIEEAACVPGEVSSTVPNNTFRVMEGMEYQRRQPVASSALVELTTRLDFFKERRSQLMEQLHSLDLSHDNYSHGIPYKASSPWASPDRV